MRAFKRDARDRLVPGIGVHPDAFQSCPLQQCLHTTTYNVSTANAERRAGLKVGAHTKALSVSVSSVVSKRLYGCSRGLVCRVARRASDTPRADEDGQQA